MKIAYIADEPRIDAVNLQFLETAKKLKPDFEFKFFFLSDKSCKESNIIDLIKEIECEYIVYDIECGCKSKYDEANIYFISELDKFKTDIVQTGFCLKYLECCLSNKYKSYGIFFKNNQDYIFNNIPGNLDIISKFNNIIITYDILDYYDNLNFKLENEIILPNTINTYRFLNSNFNGIELKSHMKSYSDLYLN